MKKLMFMIVLAMLLSVTENNYGQLNNLLKTVKNKSVNRVNNNINKGIDKGLDAVEKDVKDSAKKDNTTQDQANQDKQTSPDKKQTPQKQQDGKENTDNQIKAQNETPSLQSYSKYDFIPGEKVIFYDDFSQDNVGDFPALWNTNGSAEIVTTNLFPGRWMSFDCRESIWTDDLITLPDNYTVEFDIVPLKGENHQMKGYTARLIQAINTKSFDAGSVPGHSGFEFAIEYFGRPSYRSYINLEGGQDLGLSGSKENEGLYQKVEQKYHMAIWIQKSRVRVYQDQTKLFDLPKAFNLQGVKMDRLRFEDGAAMVSNIRIAVGTPDTRSKLITEGKLVTYGIYFDVNKDVVKPESYGTLKDISTVLNENAGVRVKIIGFTDSDGDDKANLDLSKRRAASVKDELVKDFAVDGSRIETDGLGEGQPVAPNDTPSNKALNRRVEFVKIK